MNSTIFTEAVYALRKLNTSEIASLVTTSAEQLSDATIVVTTGIGKSGIAAEKLASSLRAHGVPAIFLHPTDALHGDCGVLHDGSRTVAITASGKTCELLHMQNALDIVFDVAIIGRGANGGIRRHQTIATGADSSSDEITSFVPSVSFITAVAVSDALAQEVANLRDSGGLCRTHPGGALGETRPWEPR